MKTKLLAWSTALAMCLSGFSATAFATNDKTPTDEPFFEDETIPETETTTEPPAGSEDFLDNAWLKIVQFPNKISYKIGEPLDLKGMKVRFGYAVAGSYLAENLDNAEVNEHLDVLQIDDSEFDSSKAGTYTIRIIYDRTGAYDRGDKTAPPQVVSFDVIVCATFRKGDVNADGVIDDTDVTLLKNWLSKNATLPNWSNADMNHDNKVNIIDLALLKQLRYAQKNEVSVPMLEIASDWYGEYWNLYQTVETVTSDGKKDGISFIAPEDLEKIQDFIKKAPQYRAYEMTAIVEVSEDYGQDRLYATWVNEDGETEELLLADFGDGCQWLDNPEVREFVTFLIEKGYYSTSTHLEYFLHQPVDG